MKTQHALIFLVTGVLTMLFLLPGCYKHKHTPVEPIQSFTLGVILPMDQEKGILREKALRTAIDAINEAGGVGDHFRINLELRSSAGSDRETVSAAAAQELMATRANLAGFITSFSSESKGVAGYAAISGYPVISGSATSGNLSGLSPYFQRLCPPDAFETTILAGQAVAYGITTAAIAVEEGDIYSQDLADAFQQQFGSGTQIQVTFSKNDPDYVTKLNQLLSGNPEAIFISMLNPDVYVEFINQLSAIDLPERLAGTTFILCDGLFTSTLLDASVGFMIGEVNGHPRNFGAMPSADTTSGPYRYFQAELMKRYQQEVASFNAQFFDIGYLYAMALEKALIETGTDNMAFFRERVNYWIRQVSHGNSGDPVVMPSLGWKSVQYACINGGVNYTGASGNCDIDAEGNTVTPYALFQIIESGGSPALEITAIINP